MILKKLPKVTAFVVIGAYENSKINLIRSSKIFRSSLIFRKFFTDGFLRVNRLKINFNFVGVAYLE